MKIRFLLLTLLGIVLTSGLKASEQIDLSRAGTLSQPAFVNLLKAQHPGFVKETLNVDMAKEETRIQSAGQEWELQMKAQVARQQQLLPAFGPDEIDQTSVGVGVARPIWSSGAYVSVDAEMVNDENSYEDTTASPSPFPNPDESLKQQVSVTFSQPLLKNFGGTQNQLGFDLSKKAETLASVQAQEAQERFLHNMLNEYLDWVSLQEQMLINEKRFKLAQQQSEEIRKRFEKNYVERIDLLRAEDSSRLAEQQYLLSRSQFSAQSQRLSLMSAIPEIVDMKPDFDLYEIPEVPDLQPLREQMKTGSRNIIAIENNILQLERQLKSVKDNTKSELNLNLRAAVKSEEQEGLPPGEDDSDDGQDMSVGLNYKKMLGNNSSTGEFKKLQIQIEQLKLERQYLFMEQDANITNLHIQLKEMQNILKLNKTLVETAEKTTDEESKIYQQGRSDLTNVISSRDRAQTTRLQYAQNALNYQKLYLHLLSLSDSLLRASENKE